MTGMFHIKGAFQNVIRIISSEAIPGSEGWEHVSVSLQHRCPTWEEMCRVKALFFEDEECVVQFHPKESEYIRNHPYCLHMWRDTNAPFKMPPSFMVGVKSVGELDTPAKRAEAKRLLDDAK